MPQVLVVENDLLVAEHIADTLRDRSLTVEVANSGSEAWALLGRRPRFLVVVTDISLGDHLSGFDIARRARELNPAVKVVYVTGLPGVIDTAGDEAPTFRKVFDVKELGEQVLTLLKTR
jgi:CheY-like chemotaxis protein